MSAIILTNPPEYDLAALAEATRKSLAILKPWTLLDTTNDPLVKDIVRQAGKYVSAIQLGVSAAYSGFTVTEEVLFLASALPIEDKDDLQDYLKGMMELAKEARDNSNKAYDAFRDVRKEILVTLENVREEKKNSQNQGAEGSTCSHRGLPTHSSDDIDALVKFSESISRFANWWDWIKVETDTSSAKGQVISCQLDALKADSTVKRWNDLRTQYTHYVQLISELEDTEPTFFRRVSSPDIFSSSATLCTVGLIEGKPQPEASTVLDRSQPRPASPATIAVTTTTTTTTTNVINPNAIPEIPSETLYSRLENCPKGKHDKTPSFDSTKSGNSKPDNLMRRFLEQFKIHLRLKRIHFPRFRNKDQTHVVNVVDKETLTSKPRNKLVRKGRESFMRSTEPVPPSPTPASASTQHDAALNTSVPAAK